MTTKLRAAGRLIWWGLLSGSAACRSAAPSAPPAPRGTVVVAEAKASEPPTGTPSPPPVDPCRLLRERSEAARASYRAEWVPQPAPCVAGKGGAFSYAVSYVREADGAESYGGGTVGEALLLHADLQGHVSAGPPVRHEYSGLRSDGIELRGVADFDGDGRDELLIIESVHEFEANGWSLGRVWHVAHGSLAPYPAAAAFHIRDFRDVDADGLPDLVVATPFEGTINGCGPDGTEISFGPEWIAHARRDGSFGYDAVSRAEVKRVCPERPATVVPFAGGGIDNDELRRRLACAVVWGVPATVVSRELQARCPRNAVLPDECAFEGVLPACVNLTQLVQWTLTTVPFSLP